MTSTPNLDETLAEILDNYRTSFDVSGDLEDPNEALRSSAVEQIKMLFIRDSGQEIVAEAEIDLGDEPWADHD